MDFLIGSRSFRSFRDVLAPGGQIHAVRDEGFMQDRTRAEALCGITVIAFGNTSWRENVFDEDTRPCPTCQTAADSLS
jgi:hypothetical protein